MRGDWLSNASRLHREGRAFALATVIARKAPQSAPVGARAIIEPDGRMDGWIGGGCVRPTILREALAALEEGRPRLVRMSPDALRDDPLIGEVEVYRMTCQGEGAVEVFIEPVLPVPWLIVFGTTPVAEALVRLADPLGFRIRVADPSATRERFPLATEVTTKVAPAARAAGPTDFAVVATMGVGDEEALEAALAGEAAYIGLVASRRKARALFDSLETRGIERARLERVTCPAGLDLGGTAAAEIALSILAQVVEIRAGHRGVAPSLESALESADGGASDSSEVLAASAAAATPTRYAARRRHRPTPRSVAGLVSGRPPLSALAPRDPQASPLDSGDPSESALAPDQPPATALASTEPPITEVDPVCGMAVEVANARHFTARGGRTFYFCCPHCKAAFERDPEQYTVAVG